MDLISYGSISDDFKVIAQMSNLLKKIKKSEIKPHRLDCYSLQSLCKFAQSSIKNKFKENNLLIPENMEVFKPSENYPSHTDEGGTSYFIGLEKGNFLIGNVSYPIVPFVLYSFEDSKLHNTNFGAIMLK
jgi:hypothetical protein